MLQVIIFSSFWEQLHLNTLSGHQFFIEHLMSVVPHFVTCLFEQIQNKGKSYLTPASLNLSVDKFKLRSKKEGEVCEQIRGFPQ